MIKIEQRMRCFIRIFWAFVYVLPICFTSCLNEVEGTGSGAGDLPANVASIAEQIVSMKASLSDIETVQISLAEIPSLHKEAVQLEDCVTLLNEHIASLESGLSGVNAVMAAMELQNTIACVTGALKVHVAMFADKAEQESDILSLEAGVAAWLGKDFKSYFEVSAECARVDAMLCIADDEKVMVDAVVSVMEAGLRLGDAPELDDVVTSIDKASDALLDFDQRLSSLLSEVKQGYIDALKSETSATKSALKALNSKTAAVLSETGQTFEELLSRLAACEEAIADLLERLEKVEMDVEQLLGLIQSVTFMSEYTSEYALAYYEMGTDKVADLARPYSGKCVRTPVDAIELNYMIRPASAAVALTSETVSVSGYYANKIQTRAMDPSAYIDFEVKGVSVTNAERGIVTVTIKNNLQEPFYYKEIGAKCALSITSGKIDITSKFVEIVPKDRSTTVYVEGVRINNDDFDIDEGQSKSLSATINPSSATNKTVTWTSSDPSIVSIDPVSGILKAEKQGNAIITATTNGIDEWGDNLTASVKVKVNPAIRLGGPLYVEVGKTAELSLDFPPAMNIESKVWMSSDKTKATVDNGIVTGVAHTYNQYTYQYNPITITCIVNGNITLTHEMAVVVPQPRQIKLNNYGDDVKSVSMKLDQTISLAGSILPATVDASLFRMTYESDGGVGWIDFSSGEIKAPGSIGSRYVYIKVRDKDKHTYMKTFVERTVIVNVEPYYVETMKFAQETITLAPDQTTVLSPVFTSDVAGKQPSYTSLNWVSSNPSVVSVNSTTGEISTLKEGSAVITATTTDANAVPSGQSAKSASCTVVVETPVAPINIGDYFYSDGTWSTTRDYSKTVIGVVFSNAGVATSDPILMRDCPKATHALVVGLTEYNSTLGQFGYSSVYNWLISNGYPGHNTDVPNGYGITKGMTAYRDANPTYAELYDRTGGPLAKHKVSLPTGVSSWYIPSYKEMKWLCENKAKVNMALSNAGGTQITGEMYWSSTLRTYNSSNECQGSPFDMINGGWYSYDKKTTPYPVRVVFAF